MAIITSQEKQPGKNRDSVLTGPGGPWHEQAPRRIRQSYQSPADERNWTAWRKYLAKRAFRPMGELLPGRRSALCWALPDGLELDQVLDLIESLRKLERRSRHGTAIENEVACWLAHVESTPATVELGLASLAWCGALPSLTAHLPARLWWLLANRLISLASVEDAIPDDPLAGQLLFGELPLALAYSLPELEACGDLGEVARNTISRAIAELLDGEGLPHGRHLHLLRPLLACWTRSQAIAAALDQRWCKPKSQRQFAGLVEHALRLSRPNGQQIFAGADSSSWDSRLLEAALGFADDRTTRRLLGVIKNGGPDSQKDYGKSLPPPAFQSEWAGIAMMRPDWSPAAPRLTVSYGAQHVASELSVDNKCLWSGNWEVEVCFNGRPLEPLDHWEQRCWVSDDDVDYLELELQLSEEVAVQRHILLGRKDRFVFLADAVMGIQQGTIDYRGTLPVNGFSTFHGELETREGSLRVGRRARAHVLPLALSEWRTGASCGNLQAGNIGLELTQAVQGQCLFAPLLIDLDARRLRKEVTWRQLTVAQQREITPSDVAVGYRAQAGKSQWLVYRSLAPPDVRTVLGKNLMTEFLVGHFRADGHVKALLEIE